MTETLSARCARLREAAGLSYQALGDAVGKSQMAVYNAINEKPMLVGDPARILRLCLEHLEALAISQETDA